MIKKCLFPVAGYGTRFFSATQAQPKEMLPILTKPLIQYDTEAAHAAGMNNIAFVTGRGKRTIEEVQLDSIRELINQCTFSYPRQTHIPAYSS